MLSKEDLENVLSRVSSAQWSKNAFNCHKCPKEGCPAFWDIKYDLQNTDTKQVVTQSIRGCSFALSSLFLTDLLLNSYQTRDSVNQKSDELSKLVKMGVIGLAREIKKNSFGNENSKTNENNKAIEIGEKE